MRTRQTHALPPPAPALPKSGVFGKGNGGSPPGQSTPASSAVPETERLSLHVDDQRGGQQPQPPVNDSDPDEVMALDALSDAERLSSAGTLHKRKPLAPEIQAAVNAGAQHKKRFGPPNSEQAKAMARAYKAALVPRRKPGRRPNELTVRVAQQRMQGVSWCEIFEPLGFQALDKYERTCRKDSLRRVVRAFMARNGMITPLSNQTRDGTANHVRGVSRAGPAAAHSA